MVLPSVAGGSVLAGGGGAGALALLQGAQLRRQVLAEVLGLEHRADLDRVVAEGRAAQPRDRLVHRLHLPEPEARDELLALGERPVDDRRLAAVEAYAHALRARLDALTREHHARAHQL